MHETEVPILVFLIAQNFLSLSCNLLWVTTAMWDERRYSRIHISEPNPKTNFDLRADDTRAYCRDGWTLEFCRECFEVSEEIFDCGAFSRDTLLRYCLHRKEIERQKLYDWQLWAEQNSKKKMFTKFLARICFAAVNSAFWRSTFLFSLSLACSPWNAIRASFISAEQITLTRPDLCNLR